MSIEELIVNVVAALFSIGAILLVLYYINKKALQKAKRMNEELKKLEKEKENQKEGELSEHNEVAFDKKTNNKK